MSDPPDVKKTQSNDPAPERVKELLAVTGSTIRPGGIELTARAVKFCRFGPRSRVADIGCGVGGSLEYLHGTYNIDCFGMDPSGTFLYAAHRRSPGCALVQGIAEGLPFKDCCLDGILCECVTSLIADIDSALLEFWRVLKPGGYVVISDIYARFPSEQNSSRHLVCPSTRTKEETAGLLLRSRFSLRLWEDHTDKLKNLAVQLTLAHGSVDSFRKALCRDDRAPKGRLRHPSARPGYFLLIAQKPSGA